MAIGAVTISGAFTVDAAGRANTKEFLEATFLVSGSQVFVLPDANSSEFWVGVTEGGG